MGLGLGLLALGGGVMQGIGAGGQSERQEALADFNSRQSGINAVIAQQNADARSKALRKSGRQLTGQQRTQYAKSGVRLEGTALEVMAKTMENIELDAINIKQQGKFEAQQHKAQSQFSASQADGHGRAGTLGLVSGVLGGVTGGASAGLFG